jgi:hypothetical protein
MKRILVFFRRNRKRILIAIIALLAVIQFIRPQRNAGNADGPNDITHFTSVTPEVKNILQTSCYDCHSDHTEYPWYTNIQPVGWWLQDHVNEGKREVNFSQFSPGRIRRAIRKFHEITEQVEEGEMPLSFYTLIHGNAKLSAEQSSALINWAKANEDSLKTLYPDSVIQGRR